MAKFAIVNKLVFSWFSESGCLLIARCGNPAELVKWWLLISFNDINLLPDAAGSLNVRWPFSVILRSNSGTLISVVIFVGFGRQTQIYSL